MGKIDRYEGNFDAFAVDADVGDRNVFGDPGTASNNLTDNMDTTEWIEGWRAVAPKGSYPTVQDFNALGFTLGQSLAYLHQQGIPEWDDGQEYFIGAYAVRNANLYKSLTDSNINNDPETDATNWQLVGHDILRADRSYTVGGVGDDFATIGAALEALSLLSVPFIEGGVTVTLTLDATYEMGEQILVDGVDLSWITITATAPVTVLGASITESVSCMGYSSAPAIGVINGGRGPVIDFALAFDGNGTLTSQDGIFVSGVGSALICTDLGVTDAGRHNVYVVAGGTMQAESLSCPDADNDTSVYVRDGMLDVHGAVAVGSDNDEGIVVSGGRLFAAGNVTVDDCGKSGIQVINGGEAICSLDVSATGCGETSGYGINLDSGGRLSCASCDASVTTSTAGICYVGVGARMTVSGTADFTSSANNRGLDVNGGEFSGGTTNCATAGGAITEPLRVQNGGRIARTGGTGTPLAADTGTNISANGHINR